MIVLDHARSPRRGKERNRGHQVQVSLWDQAADLTQQTTTSGLAVEEKGAGSKSPGPLSMPAEFPRMVFAGNSSRCIKTEAVKDIAAIR